MQVRFAPIPDMSMRSRRTAAARPCARARCSVRRRDGAGEKRLRLGPSDNLRRNAHANVLRYTRFARNFGHPDWSSATAGATRLAPRRGGRPMSRILRSDYSMVLPLSLFLAPDLGQQRPSRFAEIALTMLQSRKCALGEVERNHLQISCAQASLHHEP